MAFIERNKFKYTNIKELSNCVLKVIMLNTFGILQSKYRNIRKKWQEKTPKRKWDFIFNIGRVMSELIGLRIFSDMKIYWYTASSAVLLTLNYFVTAYTIQYYFRRSEFVRGIECTCFVGITTLVGSLLINEIFSAFAKEFFLHRMGLCTGRQSDHTDLNLTESYCLRADISIKMDARRNMRLFVQNILAITRRWS